MEKLLMVKKIFNNKERNILVFSQIINGILGLVLGKTIAVFFTAEEFGFFNLQFALYTFFFSFFLAPFLQYMKVYINKENFSSLGFTYPARIFFSLFAFCAISIILLFIIFYKSDFTLALIVLTTLLFNFLFNLYTDYFNLKGKLTIFSYSNIIKSIVSLITVVVFYKVVKASSIHVLWLVQLLGFLLGIVFFYKYYNFFFVRKIQQKFKELLNDYLKYTWPLMLLAFWGWVNSYVDRYIIGYYMQTKDVGIYNANLGLGSKVFLLLNPIFLALITPSIFSVNYGLLEKKKIIIKYSLVYAGVSFFILSVLYFGHDFFGILLLSKNYQEGFYIIFWSALAYYFLTSSYIFEVYFYAHNKTKVILFTNIASALVSIAVNFILIPNLGLTGAAFGLVTGTLVKYIITYLIFRNLKE
ncbi:oligosaccharide flippase family protein [Chryseobacterium gambrini]|uniref:Oligosaccharide flippase family protein n=1 Tax=Chryseobacterium gambrini TaxID=373672 RepID=A0ABN7CCS8_9FLAO|nr:oligosaccharide flippase family protein [Chryseobacterium gambrini]